MRRTPIKTGTQLIFPVLRIGDFFCVFLRYQMVINCVFSYFNWVITQIRSLIKVLGSQSSFGALVLLSVSCDLDVSLPINSPVQTAVSEFLLREKNYLQHSVLFAISPANATLCIRPLVKDSMSRTNWHISQCLEFFKK